MCPAGSVDAAAVSAHCRRADWTEHDTFEALKARKAMMHRAAREVMEKVPAVASAEDGVRRRAHGLTTARQHLQRGRWEQLRCMRNVFGLYEALFFDCGQVRGRLDEGAFAAAMRAALWEQTMLELHKADAEGRTSEQCAAMRAKADRTMLAWGPCRRRRIIAMSVLKGDAVPAPSHAAEVECLEAHWGPILGHRHEVDAVAAQRLLRHGMPLSAMQAAKSHCRASRNLQGLCAPRQPRSRRGAVLGRGRE